MSSEFIVNEIKKEVSGKNVNSNYEKVTEFFDQNNELLNFDKHYLEYFENLIFFYNIIAINKILLLNK